VRLQTEQTQRNRPHDGRAGECRETCVVPAECDFVWALEHLRLNYGGGASVSSGAIPWKEDGVPGGDLQWSPDLVAFESKPLPGDGAPRTAPGGEIPWY
jgi:hypothetical protein